jgi:polyribonucleotide nucleotidyltransferase
MILATAVGRQDARPDADFFPLTVDVEERMYAAGKIPGGFFKREGRATERCVARGCGRALEVADTLSEVFVYE